ncbi:MAG: disulfide bond formation protein B [Paracoccaceae bacterium]|nr:disulfide bond formation protein B [Paracoccaceae bacterium]
MTRTQLIILATGGSLALLAGALGFQYLGGLPPCQLCVWQRWAHALAIAVGAVAMISGRGRALAGVGCLIMIGSAGLAGYHAGVEQGWWPGLASCAALPSDALSAEERLAEILATPVVRCDAIPWAFAGLSMAGWNAVASLLLALAWWRAFVAEPGDTGTFRSGIRIRR